MIFSKLEREYVRFFSEDEDRMRIMSSIEERKYKRELLMNKRYIDCIGLAITSAVPDMLSKI